LEGSINNSSKVFHYEETREKDTEVWGPGKECLGAESKDKQIDFLDMATSAKVRSLLNKPSNVKWSSKGRELGCEESLSSSGKWQSDAPSWDTKEILYT
jgi:hypothetical protein